MAFAALPAGSLTSTFQATLPLASTQKRSSSPAFNIAARRIMQQTMVAPVKQIQQQYYTRQQQQQQQYPSQSYQQQQQNSKPQEEEKINDMEQEQHDIKCVCELCSCGTHQCPRTPRSNEHYASNMRSSYGDTYIHHNQQNAPKRITKSDVERDTMGGTGGKFFDGKSTFKSDYPAWSEAPPNPAQPLGQTISIVDRDAKFTHTTNYSEQYPGKMMHVSRAKAPPTVFETAGKFEGESVARTDYKPWDRCAASPCRPAQRRNASDETRDFQTTSSNAFNEKGYVARPAVIPFTTRVIDPEPFNGRGTMANDFPDWGKVAPSELMRPKERRDADGPDEREFQTEKSSQFKNHNVAAPARATAPLSHVLDTETSFYGGKSASHDDFRGDKAEPAELLRPKYRFQLGEDETRDFKSESRSQFPFKHAHVDRAHAPPSVFVSEADDRTFESEAASKLRNHGYQARASMRPEMDKRPDSIPFTGTSTHHESFQKWNEKPRETCKPQHTLKLEDEDRSFLTEFGANYEPKQRDTCISSTLHDKHIKEHSGHLFYEKKGHIWTKKV